MGNLFSCISEQNTSDISTIPILRETKISKPKKFKTKGNGNKDTSVYKVMPRCSTFEDISMLPSFEFRTDDYSKWKRAFERLQAKPYGVK